MEKCAASGCGNEVTRRKIQLTGEIRLFLLYYAQKEERRLEWLEETIPLNGELACEGCSEEKIYRIQVTPASVEVEVRPDYEWRKNRKISLDMTLRIRYLYLEGNRGRCGRGRIFAAGRDGTSL